MNPDKLPDVKSPEALRFAADVLSSLETDADHYHLCNDLIDRADRLEREQAENAAREQAITEASKAVMAWVDSTSGVKLSGCTPSMLAQVAVRALADAGLLKTGEQ